MYRLLILLMFLFIPLTHAQTQESPVYAVAFGADKQIYVASVDAADNWTVTPLEDDSIYGQIDISLIKPLWHGHTLYYTRNTSTDEIGIFNGSIYTYDLLTGDSRELIQVLEPDDGQPVYFLTPQSISPDAQYIWAYETWNFDGIGINLETGETFDAPECGDGHVAWQGDRAVTSAYGIIEDCQSAVGFQVDMTTGEAIPLVIEDIPLLPYDPNIYNGITLPDGRYLMSLGNWDQSIGVFDFDVPAFTLIDYGRDLSVNASQTQAVYFGAEDHAFLVDLATLEKTDLGMLMDFAWDGDTLYAWEADLTEETLVAFPEGAIVVENDRAYIVNNERTPIGEMDATGMTRYDWFHNLVILSNERDYQSLIRNLATEETTTLEGVLVSVAPDRRWMLISDAEFWGSDTDDEPDRLIAVNTVTGQTVTLVEGVVLGQRDFHWSPWDFYTWSTQLTDAN